MSLHGTQQAGQTAMLAQAGPLWESAQIKEEFRNEGLVQYRCLLLVNGEYTYKYMVMYGPLLKPDAQWTALPTEYRTHLTNVQVYRANAASSCGTYELEIKSNSTYPFLPARLLSPSRLVRVNTAVTMNKHFEESPCCMCPFWFAMLEKHGHGVQETLSPQFIAMTRLLFIMLDHENATVEANNAQLRRFFKMRTQQRTTHIQDLSVSWVCQQSNRDEHGIFGTNVVGLARDADDAAAAS